MASFAPIRGSRTDIGNTPIVDGQFLVETDTSTPQDNRIYLDVGTDRVIVGGNANYIFIECDQGLLTGTSVSEEQGRDITFTNVIINSTNRIELYSERCDSNGVAYAGANTDETTLLSPLRYTGLYFDDSTNKLNLHIENLPNGQYYKVSVKIYI